MLALKRRRELRTDYAKRLGMLRSGKSRIVIRRSLNGTRIQAVVFGEKGDKTVVEASSKSLRKYGWKGHLGNIPAAYLTGLLFAKLAQRAGVKDGIADTGLQRAAHGSSIFAALKGCRDGGLHVAAGEEALPDESRIRGVHIAEYATKLRVETQEGFRRRFAACIKMGADPEKLPLHFDETKTRILEMPVTTA